MAVCDILASSNLDVLVLQKTWHENADSVSLRRAAPPGYSVIEEARRLTATRPPSEHLVNYEDVAIIHHLIYKSSKISSIPQVKTFEFVYNRLNANSEGDFVVASIYRQGQPSLHESSLWN